MSEDMRPAVGDFPAGTRIANYQIGGLIGRGGMAVVYRAADVRLDRQVALKVLAPELARDEAFRQRFIRESRAGAAVDHPNVIPVFEAGEADGVLFIAMRYVTGRDVRELVQQEGRLPLARVVSIAAQVASALDAAHAHGLIHRDVKPANMLLAVRGDGTVPDHVYLSDFGLSKHSVSVSTLTGTGQFLGTVDYMAPEQIEGRPVDGRSDLYALACATFEMLAGQPPFRREQNLAVMWAQVSAPVPSVRQWCPELPGKVDTVLAKALAKSPDDRFSSCLDFTDALGAAGAERPATVLTADQAAADQAAADQAAADQAAADQAVAQRHYHPATAAVMPQGVAGPGVPAAPGMAAPATPGLGAPATPAPAAPGMATPAIPGLGDPAAPGHEATVTGAVRGGGLHALGLAPSAGTGAPGPSPAGWRADTGPGADGTELASGPPWPPQAGYPPPGPPYQPEPTRKVLPVVAGCLVVAALAGAALLVLHLRSNGPKGTPATGVTRTVYTTPGATPQGGGSPASSPPVTPVTSSPAISAGSPADVVRRYYAAINNHDYRGAWDLLSAGQQAAHPYASFKQGFDATEYDSLTVAGVSGDAVSIKLAAQQSDGTVKYFSGTYYVQSGVITGWSVEQSS